MQHPLFTSLPTLAVSLYYLQHILITFSSWLRLMVRLREVNMLHQRKTTNVRKKVWVGVWRFLASREGEEGRRAAVASVFITSAESDMVPSL